MKKLLPLLAPATVGLVLILLVSIVQGVWTQRWNDTASEDVLAFALAYDKLPMSAGDWHGQREPHDMNEREREAAGAVEYMNATFTNLATNQSVSVYMICGASRDVSVHTPEACYPGAGFVQEGESQPYTQSTGGFDAQFTTAVFTKSTREGTQRLRIFWAWNADGNWEAPKFPRLKYGSRTALNKIYLITQEAAGQEVDESVCLDFAQAYLPPVNRLLFPKEEAATTQPPAPVAPPKAAQPATTSPPAAEPAATETQPAADE